MADGPTKAVLTVRKATAADMQFVCDVYNHYVTTSTATFETSPQSVEQRIEWFNDHEKAGLPVVIAESGGQRIGWGSLSFYHSRCAYRNTIEPSIYVDSRHLGKGFGADLLAQLLAVASSRGYHCLVGLICTENTASMSLTQSFGFEMVGELKEVGYKFDRWLNVAIVQKMLKQQ